MEYDFCFIGFYTPTHQRIYNILQAAKSAGLTFQECRAKRRKLIFAPLTYAILFTKFLFANKKFKYYFIPETNQFVFPILFIISRIWRRPIVFDPFISIYDDAVEYQHIIKNPLLQRIWFFLDKFAYTHSDIILADAAEHADFWAKKFKVPRDRFVVVPVGANEQLFKPEDTAPFKKFTALFYGTYIVGHGTPTIIHAAAKVCHLPIEFLMVGNGLTRKETENLANQMQLTNVRFLDRQPLPKINTMINKSQVILGLFGKEGRVDRVIPTKVFEACVVGKPIVTGESRALRRFFVPGKDILLVPQEDPAALAAAIEELYADSKLRRQLSKNSQEIYHKHLSIGCMGEKLRDIMR